MKQSVELAVRGLAAGAALKVGGAVAGKLGVLTGAMVAKATALAASGAARVFTLATTAGPVLLYALPAVAAGAAVLGYLRAARSRLEREGECLDVAGVALLEAALARGSVRLLDAPTASDPNCWRKGAEDRKNGRYMRYRPLFGWKRLDVAPAVASSLELPIEVSPGEVLVLPWAGEWLFGAPWEFSGRFPTAIAAALAMVGRLEPTKRSRADALRALKWARAKIRSADLTSSDREALARLSLYALAHVVTP